QQLDSEQLRGKVGTAPSGRDGDYCEDTGDAACVDGAGPVRDAFVAQRDRTAHRRRHLMPSTRSGPTLIPGGLIPGSLIAERSRPCRPQLCPRAPSPHRNANRSAGPPRVSASGGGGETGTEQGDDLVSLALP